MAYFLYIAVKLICYIAWCWVGLRVWRVSSARFIRAAGFGTLRLAIGVAFGLVIFLVFPTQRQDLLWKYVVIYAPVRMAEWFILAVIMRRKSDNQTSLKSLMWCLGGIVVSFAADFASPEGVAGHFCVGRCLC
jgi:hypothetical protein